MVGFLPKRDIHIVYMDEILSLEKSRSVILPLITHKLIAARRGQWFEWPDGGAARRSRMRRRRAKRKGEN